MIKHLSKKQERQKKYKFVKAAVKKDMNIFGNKLQRKCSQNCEKQLLQNSIRSSDNERWEHNNYLKTDTTDVINYEDEQRSDNIKNAETEIICNKLQHNKCFLNGEKLQNSKRQNDEEWESNKKLKAECNSTHYNMGNCTMDEERNKFDDIKNVRNDCHQQEDINNIRKWAIECNINHNHLEKLLKILRRNVYPNLPKCAKTFLFTNINSYTSNIRVMDGIDGTTGEFVYFGIEKWLEKHFYSDLHTSSNILLQFNIDGMTLFRSSSKQFWPILCKIIYEPDIYSPFCVAIYSGTSKPADSFNFFQEFIQEINKLLLEDFIINGKKFKIKIHSFICDTPARKFLKTIVGHGGYGACERCETYGISIAGKKKNSKKVIYPRDIYCRSRTDETFRKQNQLCHHTGQSSLLFIQPPIDMIKMFPLEYMHLACLGIMKKLYLDFWYFGHTDKKLKPSYRRELDKRIEFLKQWTPYEFQRKPRKPVVQLKATELRFILLYIGPVLFKNILDVKIYKHYCLLHAAFRILCCSDFIQLFITEARKYLDNFFDLMSLLYGDTSMTINVHNLIHVVDDVEYFNCSLNYISAFSYENMLGKMRKLIRSGNRPLSQICRRLQEMNYIVKKPILMTSNVTILKQQKNHYEHKIFKVNYKGFILSTKSPNNYVLLKSNLIIKITDILYHSQQNIFEIKGHIWNKIESMYKYPIKSKYLREWKLAPNISSTIISCNLDDVLTKIVIIPLINKEADKEVEEIYASALLHATQN